LTPPGRSTILAGLSERRVSQLRRIVMIRHGETVGNSRERLHGAADLALSEEGRAQMRVAGRALHQEVFDVVVASPLRRSWQSAKLIAPCAPVLLVAEFREVDFGRWEGMSLDEVKAADPVLYADWQARKPGFEYPGGEPRAAFRERVARGLARVEQTGAQGALLVVHKGVIRTIAELLRGAPLEGVALELGGRLALSRDANGRWFIGRDSSNPPALEEDPPR
jgi:broad specificity phosphatase PhoE